MIGRYTFGEAVKNGWSLLLTKVFHPKARLVRRPFYLRGKSHLCYGAGFTTGYDCRFDLGGHGKTLRIGKNCKLNDRVHIVANESVVIGDNVLMASNIFISDTSHGSLGDGGQGPDIPPDDRILVTDPVSIGDNVWIGEGVSIMPGVHIEDGCVIGTNAVVTRNFARNTVLAGVPAKAIKTWDSESGRWSVDPS